MNATPDEIEKYLKLLAATPQRIALASRGVENTRFELKPDKAAWSANDVLAHLRSCADVWGGSIEQMLIKDYPKLPYVHPRQWIKKTNYPELEFHASRQAFASQRRELLKLLKNLALVDWSRAALIKGREHTVFTQVRRMSSHEDVHCEQIKSLLKSLGK